MHFANYIVLGLLIACMFSAGAVVLRESNHIELAGSALLRQAMATPLDLQD